ncbi:MAG: hypothetical protein H6591_02495 [Flavobacteriales bacterium]|nr:hypothetical protein [Flavobacteriales bacterium]
MKTEDIHKELELVQDVMQRMASNSFEVKKWLIGLLTALVVFKQDELLGGHDRFCLVLLLPIFGFWFLDAYFLRAERAYRNVYDWCLQHRGSTDKYLFDLSTRTREFPTGKHTDMDASGGALLLAMFAPTMWPFYVIPTVLVLLYAYARSSGVV